MWLNCIGVSMNSTNDRLTLLKDELREGLSLSMQGSYERRLPSAAALPKIRAVLKGLRILVNEEPSADAYRALALAEEALLHYPAAVVALEAAVTLSSNVDRKDLKRLAQLRDYAAKWQGLGLTPSALRELERYLEVVLCAEACDHTHRHTATWLSNKGMKAPNEVLQSLTSAGGHCDCEVLLNVT